MCLKCVSWRISYFNSKKAVLVSLGIIIFFFLSNIHLNFVSENILLENDTFIDACLNSRITIIWIDVNISN